MGTLRRAFLCSGQGQRLSGLGAGLLEHPRILQRASALSAAAGRDIPGLLSGSIPPEDLLSVHLAQVSHALLVYALEREKAPFDMVAGHSLGELSAFACAGILSDTDIMRLASVRGKAMAEACADSDGGMLALIGLPLAELEQGVQQYKQQFGHEQLWIANYNTPSQLVLSGIKATLETCAAYMGKRGVRTVMLSAAGAFHSPLMARAAEKVYAFAASLEWRAPYGCCLSSMTGKLLSGQALAAHCALQIISPVRWIEIMKTLHRADIRDVVETGPSNTLGRFFNAFPDWDIKTRIAGSDSPATPANLPAQGMNHHE